MIDGISIFTKGGIVLWSNTYAGMEEDNLNNHINQLVKDVLIEDRAGSDCLYEDKIKRYGMKWKVINNIGLIFVVAYEGVLKQLYLNYILDMLSKEFISYIGNSVKSMKDLQPIQEDKDKFKVIVDKILIKADREVKAVNRKKKEYNKNNKNGNNSTTEEDDTEDDNKGDEEGEEEEGGSEDNNKVTKEELMEEARRKLRIRANGGKQGKKGKDNNKEKEEVKGINKKKNDRVWDTGKVNAETMRSLDMSKMDILNSNDELNTAKRTYLPTKEEEEYSIESDDIAAKDDLEDKATANGIFAKLTRQVKNITGNQVLTEEDLEPVLAIFKDELMTKNVAMDVANAISDGVKNSLVGTRTNQFTSIKTTVKQALTDSISRILTPKKSVDVLKAATEAKAKGEVYSIVFLGVNGVGKSTNLSKVAYYLRKKGGLKVLICACDTFRAGAVEQLKTHARCLNVELFERGYGKDAAEIAKQGLYYAKQNGYDVVLIDTAGRMQDNEPLMKSLARLVAVNNPNLILFVGEALVGYDAIDQLAKFNTALIDYSLNPTQVRGIDGILLTKYDTVDDKVGAALSMVYITGQPIVFVGTGEKYTQLRKLQVNEVVKALMA